MLAALFDQGATALVKAIIERNQEVVEELIPLMSQKGFVKKYHGETPLHMLFRASKSEDVDEFVVEKLVTTYPVLGVIVHPQLGSHVSAHFIIDFIIGKQAHPVALTSPQPVAFAQVNATFQSAVMDQNIDDDTQELINELLGLAVEYEYYGVTTRLLAQGAKPNTQYAAAAAGDMEYFIDHKRDLPSDSSEVTKLLWVACKAGRVEYVDLFLSDDAVRDKANLSLSFGENDETPLLVALKDSNAHVGLLLLSKLLHWAEMLQAETQPERSISVFSAVDRRQNPKGEEPAGSKRVHINVLDTNSQDSSFLMEQSFSSNKRAGRSDHRKEISAKVLGLTHVARDGMTVLMALCALKADDDASRKEVTSAVQKLKHHFSSFFETKLKEEKAATQTGHSNPDNKKPTPAQIKKCELDYADLATIDGDTAMTLAIRKQNNAPLAVALKTSWGCSVTLQSASVIGGVADFKRILDDSQETANINLPSGDGWTALHLACRSRELGSEEKVALLLDRGAQPNLQSSDGWTPLMLACDDADRDGNIGIVHMLIEAGADLDLQNKDGSTALVLVLKNMKPFTQRQIFVASLLVRHGADVWRPDHSGYAPIDDCAYIAGEALHVSETDATNDDIDPSIFGTMIQRGVDFRNGLEKGKPIEEIDGKKQYGLVVPDFDEKNEAFYAVESRMNNYLLTAYSAMDHDDLARCTKDCFLQEGLHAALMKGITLANLSHARGNILRSRDGYAAGDLFSLSNRLQLAVSSLLDIQSQAMETSVNFYLAKTRQGLQFLSASSKFECKAILAHPKIQAHVQMVWWDWLFKHPWSLQGRPIVVSLTMIIPLALGQICLLPLVALWPPLVHLDLVRDIFDSQCRRMRTHSA